MIRRWSRCLQVDYRVSHALLVLDLTQTEDVLAHDTIAKSGEGLQLERPGEFSGICTTQGEFAQVVRHQVDELNNVLDMVLEVFLKLL